MREKSRAVIQSALSSYDFTPFQSLCDVGGGCGQFLQAALQRYPRLHGTLFELPEVIDVVKRHPSQHSARLELIAGNFFESIPEGRDLYLLKSVLHDWNEAQCREILAHCHQAMKPDSRIFRETISRDF